MQPAPPPRHDAELIARVDALAGRLLRDVATEHGFAVPADLRRNKGWIGNVLEFCLGATASSRAEPDFPGLGIEMKSLPVTPGGRPRESTYVCTAPLDGSMARHWEDSWPRKKLSRVLWVPILGDGSPGERQIGHGLLWTPDPEETSILRQDYEEITDLIALGDLDRLTGRTGRALHLRPKAASSADQTWVLADDGGWSQTVPRGFYLRQTFTRSVLEKHFLL